MPPAAAVLTTKPASCVVVPMADQSQWGEGPDFLGAEFICRSKNIGRTCFASLLSFSRSHARGRAMPC